MLMGKQSRIRFRAHSGKFVSLDKYSLSQRGVIYSDNGYVLLDRHAFGSPVLTNVVWNPVGRVSNQY